MNLINIITSTFWTAIGFLFGKGAILITISLVSMFLSVSDFTKFNLFLMVLNAFAGVIGLSMNITRKSLRGKERKYFFYFHFINYLFIFGCVNIFDFRNFSILKFFILN